MEAHRYFLRKRARKVEEDEEENKPKPTAITIGRRRRSKIKSVLNIPDDIMQDIMLKRLPFKSLLLSKAVCKSWHDLISDPQFVKSHLDLATKKWERITYCHLSTPAIGIRCKPLVSLSFINRKASEVKTVDVNIPFPEAYRHEPFSSGYVLLEVLGSCNGLVLIGFSHLTLLWNPSTGECSRLGDRNKVLSTFGETYISGLAYNSSVNEYKAVVLKKKGTKPPHMFICSMSRSIDYGRWKKVDVRVQDFPYRIYESRSHLLFTVNGAPHWLVSDYIGSLGKTIIYFDTVEEKFKKLPTPPPLSSNQILHNIAFLGGCLCTVQMDRLDFEVWALKEYGVKESWTKLFVIQRPSMAWSLIPLGFTRDGDEVVLLNNLSMLVAYNLNSKKHKLLVSADQCHSVGALYVESLVSPYRIGKTKGMPI